MTTKTKAPPATLEQEHFDWLKQKNAGIVLFALTPAGERIQVQNILIDGLVKAGWQIGYTVIERGNSNTD